MGRIVLIGYMGAGKTTIGKVLARQKGWEFFDLDKLIEASTQRSIQEIFAEEGEKRFREIERDLLREVCLEENAVIAVGGGAPCFFDNMAYLNSQATTVYIKASVDTLIEHIHISTRLNGAVRPLLLGMDDVQMREFISGNLSAREPYYTKAKYILDIETLRTEEQIEETAKKISAFL